MTLYNFTQGPYAAVAAATSFNPHPGHPHVGLDPANNLGFGLGRLARAAFDALAAAWQSAWAQGRQGPSEESLSAKRQISIYRKGLAECVQQLGHALEHLRKNPSNPGALKKLQTVANQYAVYLAPQEHGDKRTWQLKAFKPLEEKIARLSQFHLQAALKQLLPFPENLRSKRALHQTGGWPASF